MAAAESEEPTVDLTLPLKSIKGERIKAGQCRYRIPSIEEVVSKEEKKWTVFSGSQNLSAALNDPTNRELDLFTRTWGSYFTPNASLPPSHFPSIELPDFLRYLKETSSGRKIHRAIVRQLAREKGDTPVSPISPGDFLSLNSQDGKDYNISSVPRIFMQGDFTLKDPPTFQEVLPLAQLMPKKKRTPKNRQTANIVDPSLDQVKNGSAQARNIHAMKKLGEAGKLVSRRDSGEARHRSEADRHQSLKLLHEKLTHYLDIVEINLTYQISQRSDIFFSTLSSQQELQSYVMQVRQEVMEVRHRLREVRHTSIQGSLQLFKKCIRYKRLEDTNNKLKLISTVQDTQPTIQLLLRKSDFVGALDLITTTQEVLRQELHGVHALRHLGSQLAELENAIEKMMEADLVEFAMQDVQYRLEMCRDESLANEASESEERLELVVMGLLRQGKFHFLAALRKNLIDFLKAKVKGIVSGYLQGEDNGEEPPSIADFMREMNFEAWLDMLVEVFDRMLHCQSAVHGSMKVIADVCGRAGGIRPSSVTTPTHPSSLPHTPNTAALPVTPIVSTLSSPPISTSGSQTSQPNDGDRLEYFEVTAMAQEAEDRLAQLAMDEELSDARLGFGIDEVIDFPSESTILSSSDRNGLGSKVTSDLSHSDVYSLLLSEMVTQQLPTNDPRDKERLEESVAVASFGKHPPSIITTIECQRLLMECHDTIAAACHLVHARCAKILSIRARAGLLEDLISSDFLSLVHNVEDFVRRSTVITGIQCLNLRIALQSQAKAFLDHFHESSRNKLSYLLEGECWKQADVPAEIQTIVNRLEAGIPLPHVGTTSGSTSDLSSNLPPTKFIMVHGYNFAVVGSVPLFVKMLLEYCQYADSLPMLINEVMTKLIETIKYFNTRTYDLVLGAEAMNAVGLKAITARHLGLMMRCLQTVNLLIPDLRTHFELRLEKQQHILLTQFDVVSADFSRHCNQINSKLLNLMDDVIQKNLAKWEVKQPIPSVCFRIITKQIVKLHENLVDILPPQQLEALFANIEVMFRSRLKEQLSRLGITNNGSTRHGIVNSELHQFEGALSSLDNISSFGSSLFDVWSSVC